LWGLAPDPDTDSPDTDPPDTDPPDGEYRRLADLPADVPHDHLDAGPHASVPEARRIELLGYGSPYGAGFSMGGAADQLAPGMVLAGLADGAWADGLGNVSDDGLIGLMRAWRRLSSWATAGEAAAVAELDRRRTAQVDAGADPRLAEHVGDEIAPPLTLTMRAADLLLDFACSLRRLPLTSAALAAGDIDRAKAHVITDELTGLADSHAAAVEAAIITRAPGQTTGQLRAAARRAVLAADPAAARTRREQAQKEARVEVWDEPAGTAALAGRDLPPADVLAADKHISSLARRLQAAGAEGNLDQLRARVYTSLLAGCSPDAILSHLAPAAGSPDSRTDPATGGRQQPSGRGAAQLAGSVNLTVPLATLLDGTAAPGEVAGFGPLAAGDAQALLRRLAAQPATRWCVSLTDPAGRALAHGCARLSGGSDLDTSGRNGDWELSVTIKPLASGDCSHQRESAGYRPSPSLRHLISIRQPCCSYPGCRRPASRCDLDHTVPFDRGGRTCECNLAPLCRRHHQAKQVHGWQLDQTEPGTLIWRLPHGRSYRAEPDTPPGEEPRCRSRAAAHREIAARRETDPGP
jgi:hypothetical protein